MFCTYKWGVAVSLGEGSSTTGELAHEQTLSVPRRQSKACGSNIMPDQRLVLVNGEYSESFVVGLRQK